MKLPPRQLPSTYVIEGVDRHLPRKDLIFQAETKQTHINSSPTYPCQAIVLYDFEAANGDEMSVKKDEKIFIETKTEDEGWLIARGRDRSGLVPEAYVRLLSATSFSGDSSSFETLNSSLIIFDLNRHGQCDSCG